MKKLKFYKSKLFLGKYKYIEEPDENGLREKMEKIILDRNLVHFKSLLSNEKIWKIEFGNHQANLFHVLAIEDLPDFVRMIISTPLGLKKLNSTDENGNTPLHMAFSSLAEKTILILCEFDADLLTSNKNRLSPACINKESPEEVIIICKKLLVRTIDDDAKDVLEDLVGDFETNRESIIEAGLKRKKEHEIYQQSLIDYDKANEEEEEIQIPAEIQSPNSIHDYKYSKNSRKNKQELKSNLEEMRRSNLDKSLVSASSIRSKDSNNDNTKNQKKGLNDLMKSRSSTRSRDKNQNINKKDSLIEEIKQNRKRKQNEKNNLNLSVQPNSVNQEQSKFDSVNTYEEVNFFAWANKTIPPKDTSTLVKPPIPENTDNNNVKPDSNTNEEVITISSKNKNRRGNTKRNSDKNFSSRASKSSTRSNNLPSFESLNNNKISVEPKILGQTQNIPPNQNVPKNTSTKENEDSFIFDVNGNPSFRVMVPDNNPKVNKRDDYEKRSIEFKSFDEHYDYEKSRQSVSDRKSDKPQNDDARATGNFNQYPNKVQGFGEVNMEKNMTFGVQPVKNSPNKNEDNRTTFGSPDLNFQNNSEESLFKRESIDVDFDKELKDLDLGTKHKKVISEQDIYDDEFDLRVDKIDFHKGFNFRDIEFKRDLDIETAWNGKFSTDSQSKKWHELKFVHLNLNDYGNLEGYGEDSNGFFRVTGGKIFRNCKVTFGKKYKKGPVYKHDGTMAEDGSISGSWASPKREASGKFNISPSFKRYIGFFTLRKQKYPFQVNMELFKNQVTGYGKDDGGAYSIRGVYDNTNRIAFKKKYFQGEATECKAIFTYSHKLSSIKGIWVIPGQGYGEFQLNYNIDKQIDTKKVLTETKKVQEQQSPINERSEDFNQSNLSKTLEEPTSVSNPKHDHEDGNFYLSEKDSNAFSHGSQLSTFRDEVTKEKIGGKQYVTIHEAEIKKGSDEVRKIDPYVVIIIGDDSEKSRTKHSGGLFPKWGEDEILVFIIDKESFGRKRPINVEIYNENSSNKKEFCASCLIKTLDSVCKSEHVMQWYLLHDNKRNRGGKIRLELKFVPDKISKVTSIDNNTDQDEFLKRSTLNAQKIESAWQKNDYANYDLKVESEKKLETSNIITNDLDTFMGIKNDNKIKKHEDSKLRPINKHSFQLDDSVIKKKSRDDFTMDFGSMILSEKSNHELKSSSRKDIPQENKANLRFDNKTIQDEIRGQINQDTRQNNTKPNHHSESHKPLLRPPLNPNPTHSNSVNKFFLNSPNQAFSEHDSDDDWDLYTEFPIIEEFKKGEVIKISCQNPGKAFFYPPKTIFADKVVQRLN